MPRPIEPLSDAQEDEIVSRYNDGEGKEKISTDMGIPPYKAKALLKERGIFEGRIERIHAAASRRHDKKNIDEHFFDDIDSENKAYFLGLLTADGWLQRRPGQNRVRLLLTYPDGYMVERFQQDIYPNGITSKTERVSKTPDGHKYLQRTTSSNITSDKLYYALRRLGFSSKKEGREVPVDDVIPDGLAPAYWRGIFDGDGGISIYQDVRGVLRVGVQLTCSKEVCIAFQRFCIQEGLTAKGHFRNRGGTYGWVTKAWSIFRALESMYESADESLRLNRKMSQYRGAKKINEAHEPRQAVRMEDIEGFDLGDYQKTQRVDRGDGVLVHPDW